MPRRKANEDIESDRYSFNLVKLLPNRQKSIKTLYYRAKDTINKFEKNSGEKVESFYIGKTYVDRQPSKTFHRADPHTWRKKGISDRWGEHQKKYDTMVVIGCITKSVLPEKVEFEEMQDYTLSLESELISRFKFDKVDKRIENSTLNSGKKTVLTRTVCVPGGF